MQLGACYWSLLLLLELPLPATGMSSPINNIYVKIRNYVHKYHRQDFSCSPLFWDLKQWMPRVYYVFFLCAHNFEFLNAHF